MRGEAEVKAFSKAMLDKLAQREHHGDWKGHPVSALLKWLDDEVKELNNTEYCDKHSILMEAADVANLAMMVADRCGALITVAPDSDPRQVQVGGSHYKGMAITPTEYIVANDIGWREGNAIKYISRYKAKGGKQDLEKARHYIDLLIAVCE